MGDIEALDNYFWPDKRQRNFCIDRWIMGVLYLSCQYLKVVSWQSFLLV